MKKIILLLLTLALSLPSYSLERPMTLEEEISCILEKYGTTAASIAMIDADGKRHAFGVGYTDQSSQVPVNQETMFRIGSVSKILASLSILKLVEDNQIQLDAPIQQWVDSSMYENPWEEAYPVRIVHLLSHTTGWDDLHMSEYGHNDPHLTLENSFLVYPQSRKSRWVPGTRMAYSNSGPAVAAYIVEKETNMLFEDYVQTHFFNPLSMETATYFQTDAYFRNSATLYQRGTEQPYWHIIMRPSGAINASANDMLQLLTLFITDENPAILSKESLAAMRNPQGSTIATSGLEVGHGLTHFIEPKEGFVWYGHSGGVNGGLADFKYIPELGIGYYVGINSSSGNTIFEITELLKKHLTKDLTPSKPVYTVDSSVNMEALAGYFRVVNPRNSSLYFIEFLASVGRIETRPEGIALVGILDGSVDLYTPINANQYVDPTTGKIAMTLTEDPILGTVLHNEWFTLKPSSFISIYGPLTFTVLWLFATVFVLIRAFVLLILKIFKKKIKGTLWSHILPLTQIFCLALFIRGFFGVMTVDFTADNRLISGMMAYGTVFFLVASIGSCLFFLIKREKNYAYFQGLIYSLMNLVVASYFTHMGLTGFHFF